MRIAHRHRKADAGRLVAFVGGWRIYEGGGVVKGKILNLCFLWRSEQTPLPEAGGMRVQPHFSLGDGTPFPFQFPASFSSLIYSVWQTRMSIRSRECPNQRLKVDVLTMRQPRCAPELFLLAAAFRPHAARAASGRRQSPPACAPEPPLPGWFRAAPVAVGRSRKISDSTPPDAPPAPAPSAARWNPAW